MRTKKLLIYMVIAVSVVPLLTSCGKSPDRAKAELLQMDLEYTDKNFFKVATEGNTIAIDLFLTAGIDPNIKNPSGYTALMLAGMGGHTEICKSILKNNKTDPNAKGLQDATALHLTAKKGNTAAVQIILSFQAKVDAEDKFGTTPLMYAAELGQTRCCEALLIKGAKIDFQNKWGNTALMYAAKEGKTDTVKSLLERKANPTLWNTGKKTALKFAKDRGAKDIAKLLSDAGATE